MNVFHRRCASCAATVLVGKHCPPCLLRERGRAEKRRDQGWRHGESLDPERIGARVSPRLYQDVQRLPVAECPHWVYWNPSNGYCGGCGYTTRELIALGHAKPAQPIKVYAVAHDE